MKLILPRCIIWLKRIKSLCRRMVYMARKVSSFIFVWSSVLLLSLDRAIADKIWQGLLPKIRGMEKLVEYKESVLKWGGTRNPWECLADALGNDELNQGDSRAMEIIGQNSNL